jgi:8-oxo-dGTP pyrophosphatase MutT (NUDIX family)
MTKITSPQIPLKFRSGRKTDVRAQFAALCWRVVDDQVQICLVTSRTRKRWILPKGWPMHKQTPAAAAATEAYEEAGLRGIAQDICLGVYSYVKPLGNMTAPIVAMVYPLHVQQVLTDWPEKRQRRRKWFTLEKAAKKLEEPALKKIVASFDPAHLR